VRVTVSGSLGEGTAVIPVVSAPTARLPMQRSFGVMLALMGAVLVAGMITLMGAAARESVLPPGATPDARRMRFGRIAAVGSAAVLVFALSGGRAWWGSVDRAYADGLYRPIESTIAVREDSGGRVGRLTMSSDAWQMRGFTPLIPDHGKLMHLFLVRDSGDVLLHLHPLSIDSSTFESRLGAVPAGRYRYFADIVHESGFTQTLTGTANVPPGAATSRPTAFSDPDDAVALKARAHAPGGTDTLGDGSTLRFVAPDSLVAGRDALLRFELRDAQGSPAIPESYLGMPGHAIVMRDDGSVFVHLHAMGSISPAAQEALLAIERGDTLRSRVPNVPRPRLTSHEGHAATSAARLESVLEFPFAFPKPGAYRVWVQLKRAGAIETATYVVQIPR
jgi:hypothetical protein